MFLRINPLLFTLFIIISLIFPRHPAEARKLQKERNRKWGKWSDWEPCKGHCFLTCTSDCSQTKERQCISKERCSKGIQLQERPCGICINSQSYMGRDMLDNSDDPLPSHVAIVDKCLNRDQFTEWSSWTECTKGCRSVRLRYCLTEECQERAEHMYETDFLAEERFCIPENSTFRQSQTCQETPESPERKYMDKADCERRLLKMRQRDDDPDTGAAGNGSIINLGATCGIIPSLVKLGSRRLRIINGDHVEDGGWPWQVALLTAKPNGDQYNDFPTDDKERTSMKIPENFTEEADYDQHCGGMLIAPQWILTAAHCVLQRGTSLIKRNMAVLVGENNLKVLKREKPKDESIYQIEKSIPHGQFNWNLVDNDIALVKLTRPVQQSVGKAFACLPDEDMILGNITCTAAGWGKTRRGTDSPPSNKLRKVDLPLVNRETCSSAMNLTITPNQICAGHDDGAADTCDGDSGGPLMCHVKTLSGPRYVAYGITSFGPGAGCAKSGFYGVYTKVNNYSTWVQDTIADEKNQPALSAGIGSHQLYRNILAQYSSSSIYLKNKTRHKKPRLLEEILHGSRTA